jgi:hypothetical protein
MINGFVNMARFYFGHGVLDFLFIDFRGRGFHINSISEPQSKLLFRINPNKNNRYVLSLKIADSVLLILCELLTNCFENGYFLAL